MMKKAILMLLATAWMGKAAAQTITFGSDQTWGVFAGDPSKRAQHSFGQARAVCLDAVTPSSCAPGSTLYGVAGAGGWGADLSPVPGAEWIWAPCVTGASPADLKEYWFSNTFLVPGVPTGGSLYLAVDDWAEVIVNGVVVPLASNPLALSVGSKTDFNTAAAAQNQLATFNLLPYLREGSNVITVHASNGPKEFAGGSTVATTYSLNPAGVVFGGTITFQLPVCQ
jgi:hypothetical protein